MACALGFITVQARGQIIITVPRGQVQNYGDLTNGDYLFQGAGRVDLNGNNASLTGTVAIEGAHVRLNSEQSALPNVSGITIKNGGSLTVTNVARQTPYLENYIPDSIPLFLNSGYIRFSASWGHASERINDIVLSGGANMLVVHGMVRGVSMIYESPSDFKLNARRLVREGPEATLLVSLWEDQFSDTNSGLVSVTKTTVSFEAAPEAVNGILPYSVTRLDSYSYNNAMRSGYAFSAGYFSGGRWHVNPMGASASPVGQAFWNSPTLNVLMNANQHQTLTANRSINSLRIVASSGNPEATMVDLGSYTLSVNAGAFLAEGQGSAQLRRGTLTTAQDRYFFHIYSHAMKVQSTISGAGKDLIKDGPGWLSFSGSQANTYTGTTYVHQGGLILSITPNVRGASARAVGNLVIGDGGIGAAKVEITLSHQIDDTATVTLKGGSRAKSQYGTGTLALGNGDVVEKIHTLKIEGQGVLIFGSVIRQHPTILETTRVLLPTADDTLFIQRWTEYSDYFLVSRVFAPNADALGRIWFEGWEPGAKLRDYSASHWEIVPLAAPEPASYGAILAAAGLGLWVWRRRVTYLSACRKEGADVRRPPV